MTAGHLIFVYGSLKRGERLSGYMGSSKFLGPATSTQHRLFSVDHGIFPAALFAPGHQTHGELYLADPDTLATLDRVEGSLYNRTQRPVQTPAGPRTAWIYEWNGTTEHLLDIPTGVWTTQ